MSDDKLNADDIISADNFDLLGMISAIVIWLDDNVKNGASDEIGRYGDTIAHALRNIATTEDSAQ